MAVQQTYALRICGIGGQGVLKVTDIIATGLPYTASLGLVAFCVAMAVGITLGTVAAFSKNRWINNAVALIATIGVSVPSFLIALLMMLFLGVKLG